MIEYLVETGSTNTDLMDRIRAGQHVSEGNWIVADRQIAGRGRQGRSWLDGAGNFMGSTVTRVGPADPAANTLAFVAGLAVYETCHAYAPEACLALKWPNDLLLDQAKLAGILLEKHDDIVVVGIGVNLTAAPKLPGRRTTALLRVAQAPERDVFAETLSQCFARELQRWRIYGVEPILRRWQSVAHPRGTRLRVHGAASAVVSGRFDGLGPDGSLLLRMDDGACRAIHSGDIDLH